jgi:Fe-S cluster assembly protein SufD
MNRNLLLTKGAHANSRPQLEIFADDVKCAHGSTTGQLSEAELFYFLSRGITEEKAKMMLARAFTYDVLLKIDNVLVREYLHDDITEKFENKAFGQIDV